MGYFRGEKKEASGKKRQVQNSGIQLCDSYDILLQPRGCGSKVFGKKGAPAVRRRLYLGSVQTDQVLVNTMAVFPRAGLPEPVLDKRESLFQQPGR